MQYLIEAILKRSRTILLLFGLLVIAGLSTYISMPRESTPDIQIPMFYISVRHEGLSPQDGEQFILKPLEQEFKSMEGVKHMRGTAHEGGAHIVIECQASTSLTKARADIRDRIDLAKPKLSKDARDPVVHEVNLSLLPILIIKLSGHLQDRTLFKCARDLRDAIESNVSSVLKAEIVGDRKECIDLIVKPEVYEALTVSIDEILGKFHRNHTVVAAGKIEQPSGCFGVKVPSLFNTIEEIKSLPIRMNGESTLCLSDIVDVRQTFKDPTSYAHDRLKVGESTAPTVALEISKRTGSNLLKTVHDVKQVVENLRQHWPSHLHISFAHDESDRITDMLSDLENNLICAVLLVMFVIAKFLGRRSALLVGIAVPGSFLMGILVLGLLGYTLNMVVLFSLIFSVGMLVDGAIIVVEYADKRREESPDLSIKDAYQEAAIRMAWPIITSTLTILVVFMPLLFWPGVVGQFMKFLPITLISVLTASIVMALFVLPALMTCVKQVPIHVPDSLLWDRITQYYRTFLERALENPRRVMMIAGILLVSVKLLHSLVGRGTEFFPNVEPDAASIYIHAPGNGSIFEHQEIVKQVEQRILDMPELASMYSRVGEQSTSSGEEIPEDVVGIIQVEFSHWEKRRRASVILKDIEKRVLNVEGAWVEVRTKKAGPPSPKPIEMNISAQDFAQLRIAALKLKGFLQTQPDFKNIEDTLSPGGFEWHMILNRRQIERFQTDTKTLGIILGMISQGAKVGTCRFLGSDDELDVMLRFPTELRTFDSLENARVVTPKGAVSLDMLMTREARPKIGRIHHLDGKAVVTVRADVSNGILVSDACAKIQKWLDNPGHSWPSDINVSFLGEEQDRKESGLFLLKAFGIAIFLVFTILVTQFNSFFSAILILTAIVMSTIGVFIGLIVHDLAFGVVMGGIGVIALAGIIVSNNILLIDTFNQYLSEKIATNTTISLLDIRAIIIRTCLERFRPVILTKLTAVLGLLPIMMGINIDFFHFNITLGAPSTQWWILLSTCIVYGIIFASTLTLIFTPSVLLWRSQKLLMKGLS